MKEQPEFVKKMLNSLFPPKVACLSCGREAVVREDGLCEDCHSGIELFNDAPAPDNVDKFTSVYIYNDVSSRMIKRLKYNNQRFLAKPLSEAIKIPREWMIDAVVPVPLYYRKLAKRGYNQSELIARHLCERLSFKLDTELLVRVRDTGTQTELTETGRRQNMKGAFAADETARGLRILLVDDVRTSGATLSACAAELKRHGAQRIYAATVCITRPEETN